MKNDIHDLGLLIDSRVRVIAIESYDERRVLETLTTLAMKRNFGMYIWSCTEGLQRMGFGSNPDCDSDSRDPEVALRAVRDDVHNNLYVFCDLHPYLDTQHPKLVRLLKEVGMQSGSGGPTLVLVSHALELPPEVQRLGARLRLSMPGEDELLTIVREEAARWSELNNGARVRSDSRTLKLVVKNLAGLSHAEARRLARNVIWNDGAITQADLPELNKARFALLDMGGLLSYEYETSRFGEVGGLRNLKQWLAERQGAFAAAGKDSPKGVMLVGVQGGGKSLAAKAVAGLWGLPLLRLDFGRLYNKFYGETERNLREALQMAERMAPCVLWMDEVEKGITSSDNDDGVGQRVLGTLLTWMAERRQSVFMVATANAIDRLPPELLRKGRFDELFFVDLPNPEARMEIFRIHLQRRELDPLMFDLALLAAAAEGFSGAEIEQSVVSALYAAQARQVAVDQTLVLQALQQTSPLSVVMAEDLIALRHWAAERTVKAD